jgi:hypothetical protein
LIVTCIHITTDHAGDGVNSRGSRTRGLHALRDLRGPPRRADIQAVAGLPLQTEQDR